MYDAPDLVTYMFHRDLCQRGNGENGSLDEKRLHYLRKFSYNNRLFRHKKFLSTTKRIRGGIYTHDVIVHQQNFVDPGDEDVHTQNVENMWMRAKRKLRRQFGTSRECFPPTCMSSCGAIAFEIGTSSPHS